LRRNASTAQYQVGGIGPVLAAVFIAEIGDISRFPTAAALCCWAGITPRHYESDKTVRRGHISKEGNTVVRWAAVEAVQRNCEPAIQAVREGIIARRGKDARDTAKVAAGRVMLEAIYHVCARRGSDCRLPAGTAGRMADTDYSPRRQDLDSAITAAGTHRHIHNRTGTAPDAGDEAHNQAAA